MTPTTGSPRQLRRNLLAGAGGAALVLSLLLPATAFAHDYTASTEAELRQAILDANADGDATSTITLTGNIAIAAALPTSTKTLIINTAGFSTNGLTPQGIVTLTGTITGASDIANGSGQAGLTMTGVATTTVTNNAAITGGNGTGSSTTGLGADVQDGTLINNGTITGGTSGGPASTIAGYGIQASRGVTIVNNGTIQGGTGLGVTGGTGAFIGVSPSSVQTFTNNVSGIVRGGNGTGGALGGVAIEVKTISVPIVNHGLIEGGNGAVAIKSGPNLNLINDGTIRAGAGGAIAIDASTSQLTVLELRAGSSITGEVIANAGATFAQTLQFGGDTDTSFDMSLVGATAQYRNFNRFLKTGTSTWTLTGDVAGMPTGVWSLQQGTLLFDKNTAAGAIPFILNSGSDNAALIFQQDSSLTIGSLTGAISVLQNGLGTTTLVTNTHSGGTTIAAGTLSIGTEQALGSGAFTITGGKLQWSGNGNIARTVNWAGSGAEIEVTGTSLTLAQPLLGGGALTKSGAGSLILSGDNSYTGGTVISAGTLRVNGTILGDVLDNGTLIFGNSTDYAYGGLITGSGSVNAAGSGLLTLTADSNYGGTTTISGTGGLLVTGGADISYGGATTLSAGQLLVNAGSTMTSGGATAMTSNSFTLAIDGAGSAFSAASMNVAGSAASRVMAVNVTNGGLLKLTAGGLSIRTLLGTARLNIDGAGSLLDMTGGLSLATVANTGAAFTISGGGAIRTGAASTIGVAAGNTQNATRLLDVTITGAGSNWTSTSSLLATNGNFTVQQGGAASFTSATFGTVSAALPARLTVSGANSHFTTTGGDLTIGSGTGTGELILSDGASVDVAGYLVLANGAAATGILSIGGAEGQAATASGAFTAPSVMLGSPTSRLNFNHTDTNYLFGSAIFGAGTINQVEGTTNLTGNSGAFSGTVNVTNSTGNGSTLRVNGTLGNAASLVNVSNGGRLGGAGTIGGNVIVTDGILAPGNSPGTLTIAGGLTLGNNSLLDYEFGHSDVVGGPLNDLTMVGGNLTLDGSIDVTVTPGGEFGIGVYRVLSYGGSLTDNGLTVGTVPGGGIVVAQTSVAGQVNLVNYAGAAVNFWDGNGARGDSLITGGNGIWQASPGNDNWTLDTGAINSSYSDGNFAIFLGAAGTVTVDNSVGAVNASGMQFATNGYTITGGYIDMTAPQSIIRVGDGTAAGAGYSATIASQLFGTGDLVKTDLGTLVLAGIANFGGDTYVRSGALEISGGGMLSNANGVVGPDAGSRATVTVTGAGSIWSNSDSLTVGYDGDGTLNVTNSGTVQSASGTLGISTGVVGTALVSGAGSSWQSTGRISLGEGGTGNLRVEAGATVSSLDSIIGSSSLGNAVVTGAGSNWTDAGQTTIGSYATGTLRIEDGATFTSGQGYIGAGAGSIGTVTVTGAGSNWQVSPFGITIGNFGSGTLAIEAGARVRADDGILLGVAAGSSGTLTLQGTAADRAVLETSYIRAGLGSVNLTLDGALLRAIGDSNAFFDGFDTQNLTIGANGLAIDTDGHNIFVAPRFIGTGGLVKDGAGALVLSGDSGYTGGTTINTGILQLGAGGTTGSVVGNVANNGELWFYRSDDMAFGNLVSGSGSITKFGTNTLTLTGTNSYAGATNVNGGTLLVNGDQSAATGLTTVGMGATLGGTGVIGGSVDMSAGGTLAAGANGVGTLTINGGLTLGSGSHLAFELGQAGTAGGALNDMVNVGGNLVLDGTLDVTTAPGGSFDVGIYRLLNYAGSLTDNGLVIGTQPAGADSRVQTSVAGQVNLVNTGGLTLNFWDGAAGPKFDGTVNGGAGKWQAHTGNDNWTDLSGALNAGYSDGAVAIFSGAAGIVTVDSSLGAVTASGMQFATNGYTITGDDVTLTGGQAVIRVGDGTAAGAGYAATIASALTGASQLVKTDLGTLILTGPSSYAGGTRIEGGTLQIGNGGANGSIAGDVVNNAALVVNRSGIVMLDGAISGSGTLTQTGGGTLILSGTNSYAGGTTITGASIVQISGDANLGDLAGVLALQGGTLQAGRSFTSNRAITLGSGTSNRIDVQGYDVTLAGTIGNGANNLPGNFLDKLGTGTLTLTGVNSYSNRTLIAAGTLALAGNGTIGAGNLIVGAGTTFDISQTDTGARVIQLNSGAAGTIALGSKLLTLGATLSFSDWSGSITDGGIAGGTGGKVTIQAPSGAVRFYTAQGYTGGTTVNGGTLALVGNGALYASGAVTVNNGAIFDIGGLTGSGTTIGDLSGVGAVALGAKALTFGTANNTSFAGTIAGAGGSLVKSGSGTLTLAGTNSYTGTTSVNAGTLLVNGDQSAATGLTSVASGATLGGSGILGGNVLIADGGTLAPGNSPGTLTINGGLTLSAGSTLAYEFGAANSVGSPLNDLVNVGGNLVLDGTINVAVSAGGAFDIGLYRIANYGGALTDNGLAIGTMPAGAELSVQTSIAGQVNLVNTGSAVLNFWDGNAGPKFDGAIAGGSGVWQAAGTDNWTDLTGAVNAAFDNGAIAIFAGTAGTVTIDNSQGAVTAAGLQFAATGTYVLQGGALTLTGPQSVIRVGDGSAAGSGYVADIQSVITGTTQLVKTDIGRLILSGTNTYTGGTAINGGVVQIASDANLGATAGGLSFNGGTLNTTASFSSARAVTLAGQGGFATDAGTTLTLTGAIAGTGSLTKTGTGTLVLSGTGSFGGGTQVSQGTLLVNGNYAAVTGTTSIAAGATLGGTGTIGGNVTLNGTLAPGAGGAGTLTIGGNLSIAQGATLAYDFGSANVAGGTLNDLVTVGGNLVLDGTIDVSQTAGGLFSAGVYRVFNYGGTLTDNGLTLGALPAGSNVAVQTSIAGQVNLVNYAGLALNFWDGAAGPKNNDVINGGTGTWQNGTGNDNWADASGAINAPYSDGAFAVFGGTAGTVTVDNGLGQVAASGMQFATGGYTITGGAIQLTGAQAVIRVGDGSVAGAGYTATINAALTGASQLVKTDAGTLILGGTNSYSGGTLITGGTVQIASDANLGAASGGLTLDGGTLSTSATLASARTVTLQGAGTFATASGTTLTLNGLLSGAGALTKSGTGTLVLGGNSAGYVGTARIAAGTLAVTGALGGAITIDAGSRLEGTGMIGAVTNAGTIAPGMGGVGTLTLTGNYTGNNGTLEIEAELGGDGARADRLVVGGATAGTTLVKVTNLGGTGAPTLEGIKIVDVAGASNGVFTLQGDYVFEGAPALIAGAYGYRLYKNGVSTPTDGDWYLRSALLNPVAPPATPLYQPGVPVYEAYGQTLATLNAIGTMQERVGNRRWSSGSDGISGIWGRMESARNRPNAVQSTSLSDVNVDSWKVELGVDQAISTRGDGSTLVVGVLGSYGEARANIASPFGNGSIKTRGYGAGATLSWFGPQGFYVDSRAQFTWFDSTLKSSVLGKLADGNDGTGQGYSVEVGKRSPLSGTLSVTPQIQMAYSTVGFDRFTDPNGAEVSSRLGDSLKTRWGISLDRQDNGSHVYGVVNLSYEWLDGTVTQVSGTPIARSNERLWGELGLGGTVQFGRVSLFSQISAETAIHDFGKSYSLKGTGGLRLAF
jgi:fibronectin-binding autotransporter adhesin